MPGDWFTLQEVHSGSATMAPAGQRYTSEVEIPSANGSGTGSPTGIVYNGSNEFRASIFLFATLDGTISGWAPQSDPNNAIIALTTAGAVYTGLAITSRTSGNFLFA